MKNENKSKGIRLVSELGVWLAMCRRVFFDLIKAQSTAHASDKHARVC